MIAIFFIFHYKTRFFFKNAYGLERLEEESEGESEESKRGREIKGEKENVCVREREREREERGEGREGKCSTVKACIKEVWGKYLWEIVSVTSH